MGKCTGWRQRFDWGDCVFVVEVIAGGGLFVYMEPFYGGQVWAFFVEL
jgi:hypothetical protein